MKARVARGWRLVGNILDEDLGGARHIPSVGFHLAGQNEILADRCASIHLDMKLSRERDLI